MPAILPPFVAAPYSAPAAQVFSPRWLGTVAFLHAGLLVGLLNTATLPSADDLVQPVSVMQAEMISEPAVANQPPAPPAAPPSPRQASPTLPKPSRSATPAVRSAPTTVVTPPTPTETPDVSREAAAHAPGPVAASVPSGNAAEPSSAAASTTGQPRFDADYLKNPVPVYPLASKRFGEEGRVVLRVFVDAGGRAESVEIKNSSGFERLDQAARDAVRRWQFVPARRVVDGATVAVGAWVAVPIVFNLRSG